LLSSLSYSGAKTTTGTETPSHTLTEATRRETINRDPEHKGINFVLSPQIGIPDPGTINPITGLPQSTATAPLADIGSVTIRLNPPLSELRVVDVLDAIVKVAGQRIRYSIEDYGIVFSMRSGSEPVPFYTRIFKVDPNTFRQGLEGVTGIDFGAQVQSSGGAGGGAGGAGAQSGQGVLVIPRVNVTGRGPSDAVGAGGSPDVTQTNAMQNVIPALRDYFTMLGVTFVPGDGKNWFYSEHGGLMVRAPQADLDTIEKALQKLESTPKSPPQSQKPYTRVFKIDPNSFVDGLEKATGLPFHNMAAAAYPRPSGTMAKTATGGTNNSAQLQTAIREYFTGLGLDLAAPKAVFYNHREGSLITRGTLQDLDTLEQAVQVLNLSPPQIHLKAKFITMPENESTAFWDSHSSGTKSGAGPWSASLSAVEAKDQGARWKTSPDVDLLNEFSITTLSGRQSSLAATDLQTISVSTNATGGLQTNQVTVGPVLDVLPVVQEDGFKIQLKLVPALWELVGEDTAKLAGGGAQPDGSPLPHLRKREMEVSATLWHGQTIVIGHPADASGQPVEHPGEKRLLVMVSASLVDPARKRHHTDEDMDAVQNGNWTKSPARDWRAPFSKSSK
jgi:Bacterial type II and III secretion system protein